ncbi:MAG: general secretion pathway protein GspH [Gammaproteobacteria bacterium]|nr:MAG: general secretion pathway protein GspH [Gammaproteobacteria bacterium]
MRLSTLRNTQQVNTQSVNKQQGFTLIELVVVIVILGILAVTAVPKFIDLTSDAKASVVEAVRGSMNSAADMAHAKALAAGKIKAAGTGQNISVDGVVINLNYGWPVNASMKDLLVLEDFTELTGTSVGTFEHTDATNGDHCRAIYNNTNTATSVAANGVTRPSITSIIVDPNNASGNAC